MQKLIKQWAEELKEATTATIFLICFLTVFWYLAEATIFLSDWIRINVWRIR